MEISSGRSAEDARALAEDILTAGIEAGFVGDATIAASLGQAADFWKLRELLSDAQRPEGASIKHDISVPVAAIPEFIRRGAAVVAVGLARRRASPASATWATAICTITFRSLQAATQMPSLRSTGR